MKAIYVKLKLDYIFHYGNEWYDSTQVLCSFIREFLSGCVQVISNISIKAETFTATATLINTLLAAGSKTVIEQRGVRRYGINTEGYKEFTQMLTFSQYVYKGSIILIVLSLYLLVIDQTILSICVCICNFGVSLVMMDIGCVVQDEEFWMKVSKETYRRALSNADEWERYLSELCKEDAVYKDSHQFTFLLDVLGEANELFEGKWMGGSIQGKDRVLLKLYVKNIYTIFKQIKSRNVLESHYLAYRNYIKRDSSEGKTKLQATIDIIAYHCLSKLSGDEDIDIVKSYREDDEKMSLCPYSKELQDSIVQVFQAKARDIYRELLRTQAARQ